MNGYSVNRIPHSSIEQTVEEMRKLAWEGQTSPLVRNTAINIIRDVRSRSELSEIAAIYYAVAKRVRYAYDPKGHELLQHPSITLELMAGDCDDMSILLASLFCCTRILSVGYDARFKLCGFEGNGTFSHVFLEVGTGGKWIALDPVAGPNCSEMLSKITDSKVLEM